VQELVFFDLVQGGTAAQFGSVPIFYEHVLEAFERFMRAGIIDATKGAQWIEQLRAAKPRLIARYAADEAPVFLYGDR
jgi:hypothetical protein